MQAAELRKDIQHTIKPPTEIRLMGLTEIGNFLHKINQVNCDEWRHKNNDGYALIPTKQKLN